MLVYIQWSRGVPQDWEPYEINSLTDWRKLPFKDEPGPGVEGTKDVVIPDYGVQAVLDPDHPNANDPGWVFDISIAGVTMGGVDHFWAGRDGPRIAFTRWADDDEWALAGDRYAQEWSIGLPVTDDELGIVQPDIQITVYAESADRRARWEGQWTGRPPARYPINVLDWADFSEPGPANMRRHGIWLEDDLLAAHMDARTFIPDWYGWASLTGG